MIVQIFIISMLIQTGKSAENVKASPHGVTVVIIQDLT